MKGLRAFSIIAIIVALLAITISCDQETPVPQGYTTPSVKGVVQLPASSGLKPDSVYLYVAETGYQAKVASDGRWEVQGLEAGKTYSIHFQNRPFNDLATAQARSLSDALYGARKVGLSGSTGSGTDAGLVQLRRTATVKGQVQARDGKAIDSATVSVPGTPYVAQTDEGGNFQLEGLPDGVYTLSFSKTGYLPATVEGVTVVTSESEETIYSLETAVTLTNSLGSIQGYIQFPGSIGTGGKVATVRAQNTADNTIFMTATSDEDGRFFIDGLASGTYDVTITSSSSYMAHVIEDVAVISGQTTFLDSVTLTAIGGTLHGKVTTSDNRSAGGTGILLKSLSGNEQYYTQVSEGGFYRFDNVVEGAYSCTVTLDGYATISDNVDIPVGNEIEHNFTLIPVTGSVTGRIKLDGAPTNGGVSVTAVNINDSSYYHATTTRDDGMFTISGLEREGKYQMVINMDGYASDASIIADITFGELTSIGTITLKSLGATVSGSIRLEGRSAHDGVEIVMRSAGIEYEETTDRAGDYFFAALPAGTYTVTISKDGFITKTLSSVVIAQSEHKVFDDLVLEQDMLPLTGNVVLEGTSNYSSVLVEAVNTVDPQITYSTMTRADGSYSIDGMEPGSYNVTFSTDGYLSKTVRVVLVAGTPCTADATLEAGTSVVFGRVVLEGANDNSCATVTLENITDPDETYIVETGSDGNFTIKDIRKEGKYKLSVEADGYVAWSSQAIDVVFGNVHDLDEITLRSVTGSVAGRFLRSSSIDHSGIAVKLGAGEISFEAETLSDGSYTFAEVPAGTYSLTASAPGYEIVTLSSVIVKQGETTSLKDTTLAVILQSINGTVTLEGLEDASGVTVTASPLSAEGEDLVTTTDAYGKFAITNVIPGNYTVTFSRDGYKDYSTTTSVTVGSATTVDASLELEYGLVTGKVLLSGAESHSGITVSISWIENPDEVHSAETEDDGSFTITGIRHAGLYQVVASMDGYATSTSASVAVNLSSVTTVDDITLIPLATTVRGRVELEGLSDHAGTTVTLSDGADLSMSAETEASGEFVFTSVQPGTYTLSASHDDYATRTVNPVIVSPSEELTIDAIVLTKEVLPFSGKVTLEGESDHSNVLVSATSVTDADLVYSTTTDREGSYSFESMKVGTYDLRFSKDGYDPIETRIVVVAGVSGSFDATLTRATGIITGTVLLESTDDCSGITVTATKSDETGVRYSTTTSADGSFVITGIEKAGTYLITASKSGFVTDSTRSVSVLLSRTASIGTITLANYNADITGTVHLEGSLVHDGITVVLEDRDGTYRNETKTDSYGEYSFTDVVPGLYYTISASKAGYSTKTAPAFYVSQSVTIEVDPIMLSASVHNVTGTIDIEGSDDDSGAVITATNIVNPDLCYTAVSDSTGVFLLGVYPGNYQVTVSKAGFRTVTLECVEVALLSGDVDLGTIVLFDAKGIIAGRAKLEGRSDYSGIKVEAVGLDGFSAMTDENGEYFLGVPEGTYEGGLLFSREDFETTSLREGLTVEAKKSLVAGEVELKCTAASINGSVDILTIDDESGVTVSINGTELSVTTGRDGIFQFDHVPLGVHTLVFKRDNTASATLEIELGPVDVLDVGLVHLSPNVATLRGTAQLYGKTNHSGITISAAPATEDGQVASTITDSDGHFELPNLDSELDYIVTISKADWDSQTVEVAGLSPLEERDITADGPITLVDTTAPVVSKVTINDGANTSDVRDVTITLDVVEQGSGADKMQYCFDNIFDETVPNIPYEESFEVTLPDGYGDKTIYVRVIDEAGNISTVTSATVVLVNPISGSLTGDNLHWTVDKSPYSITGDVLVPEGETLIIDPGVDVLVAGAHGIQVKGTIKAEGTADSRIKFYGVDEGVDAWEGIRIIGGDGSSSFDYIDLYDAKHGIGGMTIVTNSTINCTDAPSAFSGVMKDSKLDVSSYSFSDAGVENVVITGRGAGTGRISHSYSTFINCTISDAREISSSYSTFNNCTIRDVWEISSSYSTFINSTISDVLEISSSATSTTPFLIPSFYFINCTISDVDEITSFSYDSYFINCILERVDLIKTGNSDANMTIRNCNLIDCTRIYVMSAARIELDFRNNYWGEAWTAAFNESKDANVRFITDFHDDYRLGFLNFFGYFSEPIEGVGVIEGDPVIPTIPEGVVYTFGDVGPSGGIIVYVDDADVYPDFTYIEALETEITLPFGYYRVSADAENQLVGTSGNYGFGMENTKAMVEAMGNYAYTEESGSAKGLYAAKLADMAGWALPSASDLMLIGKYIHISVDDAWSSTEKSETSAYYGSSASTDGRGNTKNCVFIRYY